MADLTQRLNLHQQTEEERTWYVGGKWTGKVIIVPTIAEEMIQAYYMDYGYDREERFNPLSGKDPFTGSALDTIGKFDRKMQETLKMSLAAKSLRLPNLYPGGEWQLMLAYFAGLTSEAIFKQSEVVDNPLDEFLVGPLYAEARRSETERAKLDVLVEQKDAFDKGRHHYRKQQQSTAQVPYTNRVV